MGLVQEQFKFLQDVAKLTQFCVDNDIVITAGEMFRTKEQQALYVKEGKSKTMNSNHLRRLAIDLNFFKNGALTWDKDVIAPVGKFWESLDIYNRWGGNFTTIKDYPHFERNVPNL